MLRKSGYPPHQSLYPIAVEQGKILLVTSRHDAVIHHLDPIKMRVLAVGEHKDLPDERSEAAYRRNAPAYLSETAETGLTADILGVHVLDTVCVQCTFGPVDRIVTVHPGYDRIDGIIHIHTQEEKRSGIRTTSLSSNIAGLFQA